MGFKFHGRSMPRDSQKSPVHLKWRERKPKIPPFWFPLHHLNETKWFGIPMLPSWEIKGLMIRFYDRGAKTREPLARGKLTFTQPIIKAIFTRLLSSWFITRGKWWFFSGFIPPSVPCQPHLGSMGRVRERGTRKHMIISFLPPRKWPQNHHQIPSLERGAEESDQPPIFWFAASFHTLVINEICGPMILYGRSSGFISGCPRLYIERLDAFITL